MIERDLFKLINATDRQKDFWQAVREFMYILYGGAAGGGKSYILRWTLILRLINFFDRGLRGVRSGLFCEDYPSLRDRHISKISFEIPDWLGTYKDSTHEFTLRPEYGSGVLCLRNLDDVSKYLSSEFADIGVDELTRNQFQTFNFLRMRLRWPGIEDNKFMGATNPGEIGHAWVKGLWIDRIFPEELRPFADKFAFIPAKIDDNPHLPESYKANLDTLPEALRKAYRDGDWDVFAGQVFSEFNRDKHVCEPFEIPLGCTRYRSMDWGFSKPYAILWGAVDYDGTLYIYREMYGCKDGMTDTGTQETAEEVAKKAKKLEDAEPVSIADPACWAKTGHAGPSIAEQFMLNGVYFAKADNDRIQGKMQIHQRLKNNQIKIFSSCKHLIRTLPTLVYDQHKVEDVDTNQEDHAYDSLRYMCMARPCKPVIVKDKFDWLGRKVVEEVDWTSV